MSADKYDPVAALKHFVTYGVQFITIGGVTARVWGSPSLTQDLDICYDRSPRNRESLAVALREIHATLRGAPQDLPFQLDARTIALGDAFTFETDLGDIDCMATPSGTKGYQDLLPNSVEHDIGDGVHVRFCSLDDLIRMKKAAGRPKDLIELEILAAVKEEIERR